MTKTLVNSNPTRPRVVPNRPSRREDEWLRIIVACVTEQPGMRKTRLRERVGGDTAAACAAIDYAVDLGLIRRVPDPGKNRGFRYYPFQGP